MILILKHILMIFLILKIFYRFSSLVLEILSMCLNNFSLVIKDQIFTIKERYFFQIRLEKIMFVLRKKKVESFAKGKEKGVAC